MFEQKVVLVYRDIDVEVQYLKGQESSQSRVFIVWMITQQKYLYKIQI